VPTPRQHAFSSTSSTCFHDRISSHRAGLCNGSAPCDKARHDASPCQRRRPCYPQLLCPALRPDQRSRRRRLVRNSHPSNRTCSADIVLYLFTTIVVRHAQAQNSRAREEYGDASIN
jgi:hypothetical protein